MNNLKHVALLIGIAAMFACGGTDPLANYPSRVGEVTPSGVQLGGVFRFNESADPRSLDPIRSGESAATAAITQLFDGLVNFDSELNLIPGVAESWDVSEDGMAYTFHIRRGVNFHDDPCFPDGVGREANAHDVKFSLMRLLGPHSTGAWILTDSVMGALEYSEGEADDVEGFEVVDDYTFRIRLVEPFAPFIYRMAMSYAFITAPEAVEHYGDDFFTNPVGTGPFQFVHWRPRRDILMVRNPNYWMTDEDGVQYPYLDAVRMTLMGDLKIEWLEFDRGGLDRLKSIHEDLWGNIIDENRQLRERFNHYNLQRQELLVTQYYGFNLETPPFDNRLLRQAFNYAVNREAIIEHVLHGGAAPARAVVPGSMPNYETIADGYSFDLDKAKTLLAEAGYPNGEGLGDIVLELNSGGTTNESIAEAIQSQLRDLGVSVRLQVVEWAQHLENIDAGRAGFFRLGWIASYPDPEYFMALHWSRNFAPHGPNYFRYSNPEYDRLFEEARSETDLQRRMELYQQAEKISVEDAPWLFLINTVRYSLTQPYVRGYTLNVQEIPILYSVWLDQPAVPAV